MARGFTQVEGIDYEETFAPTAKFVTIRLIIALATSLHWPLEQADIDTAFLWSDIKEDIFMQQPEGHVDESHPDYVCKLQKSLYGKGPHQESDVFIRSGCIRCIKCIDASSNSGGA